MAKLFYLIKRNIHFTIQYLNYVIVKTLFLFKNQTKSSKNYILIFRTDAIGDFILSLDAIYTLKTKYYDKKIVLLVNKNLVELVEKFGLADIIIPFNRNKFILNIVYNYSLIKKLREFSFVKAFYLNFSREFLGDEIIKLTNSVERIGWKGDDSRTLNFLLEKGNKFYSTLIKTDNYSIHELFRNKEFVKKILKIEENKINVFNLVSVINRRNIITDFSHKKYFVVAPGSKVKKKIWNPINFTEVIKYVYTQYNLFPVLLGPKSEEIIGKKIIDINSDVPIKLKFGVYSFVEILSILKNSTFLLSNDNAMAHFAVKLGVKSVTILGGGQFGRFAPYGGQVNKWVYEKMECYNCDWICKYKEFKCVQNITADKVKESISSLLKEVNN